MVGTRQNSQGWNLNRDYIGADAPETKALDGDAQQVESGSVHGSPHDRRVHPRLRVDVFAVAGAGRRQLDSVHATSCSPTIRQRMLDREGFYVQDYGDFSQTRAGQRGGAPGGALGGGGFGSRRGPRRAIATGARPRRRAAWRRAASSLEMMIADSIPKSAGCSRRTSRSRATARTSTGCATASRSQRSVLARSVRAPRRVDVRLRERDSVVHRRAQDGSHGARASRAMRR